MGQQINLNMDNAWGIVRCVLDIIMQQKDGKYLIVKDPNKQILRLYDIPDNTFESEDDSEESEEDTDAIDTPLRPRKIILARKSRLFMLLLLKLRVLVKFYLIYCMFIRCICHLINIQETSPIY